MGVARLRDASPGDGLAAGVLRGDEARARGVGALPKREKSPTSAASAWAVTVSMPLRHLRASTVGLHLGLPADSATLASRPRFASSHLATHSR